MAATEPEFTARTKPVGAEPRKTALFIFAAIGTVSTLAACSPTSLPGATSNHESLPPNIVLIIGDDQGFRDFGFMGSEIAQTPRLDRLAAGGTVFRAGFNTSSVCEPSLLTLLTGLHPLQHEAILLRVRTMENMLGLPHPPWNHIRSVQTLPRALGESNYSSLQTGKYWLGPHPYAGFTHGMKEWADPIEEGLNASLEAMAVGIRIVRDTMEPLWTFIDDHRDEPFFIWFAPQIPHVPHNPPSRFVDLYANESVSEDERAYLASVSWFDSAVGELVDRLAETGLLERTLIVYVADNGWDSASMEGLGDGPRGKSSLYENGFRTPIVFHWPGRVPAGRSTDALVSTIDLFPTLLDYAGLPKPGGRTGKNLRPLIEGREDTVRDAVLGYLGRRRGGKHGGLFIRTPEWYFIQRTAGPPELFNMVADPEQERNVVADHPDVATELGGRIRDWSRRIKTVPSGWRPVGRRFGEYSPPTPRRTLAMNRAAFGD